MVLKTKKIYPELRRTTGWGMENEHEFICGVIEGFYGRPWTLDQRTDLFKKLEAFRLNYYVYAPKDDLKHRLSWRELYTSEEAESLRHMITEARLHNQNFVYALSPGNDIRYSDEADIYAVRKKLEQVHSLGCASFALLFDDIPKEMHPLDQQRYESFASAQVQITNRTFEALQQPTFMFCPTEYCETRAIPSIDDSEYLDTLGRFLHPAIHIMWTGPKVVSRWLTPAHCERVEKVLRRKPLIWDNYFANDYDIRRLFLGPLQGRPLAVRNSISGILLNPNNKHEANHIAIASTSQWRYAEEPNDDDESKSQSVEAILDKALASWEALFNTETPEVPTVKPQTIQDLQEIVIEGETKIGCIDTPSTSDLGSGRSEPLEMEADSFVPPDISAEVPLPVMAIDEMVHAVLATPNAQENEPDPSVVVNSLVPEYNTCTVMGTPILPCSHKNSSEEAAQMDGHVEEKSQEESPRSPVAAVTNSQTQITKGELRRLVDLFYLPFQYGKQGEELLESLHFLMTNAHREDDRYSPTDSGFHEAIQYIYQFVNEFNSLYWKIINCSNKPLLSELLPYIWETHGTLSVVEGVTHWLASGNLQKELRVSPATWKNADYDDEPWTSMCPIRGFPLDIAHTLATADGLLDLLRNRNPLPMSVRTFHVRNVTADDMDQLHYIFGSSDSSKNEELFDRYFGPYLFSVSEPQFGFISYEEWSEEDGGELKFPHCAVAGIRDVGAYLGTLWVEYSEMMFVKYCSTRNTKNDKDQKAVREEIDSWKPPMISSEILSKFPSRINLHAKCGTDDAVAAKRVIQTLATVLTYSGSIGVHILCQPDDYQQISFLAKLNFELIPSKRNDDLEVYALPLGGFFHFPPILQSLNAVNPAEKRPDEEMNPC
ncbi:unnamed protein product, partial [Mesorhabditis belari]|uniref:protein O-GlcNAcase n=1 Tax=Mesorhabditis belari TaxID=2138241 RepID=A0AAF3ESB6_9BILA